MKVIHKLTFESPVFDDLQKKFPDSSFVRVDTPEDFARECPDCDALVIAGSFYDDEVAEIVKKNARKLRWIQSSSDGLDKFVKRGVPEGVAMTNATGTKGRTIAEHALGLLIGFHQQLPAFERMRAARQWDRASTRSKVGSIEGQTLVVIGYGMIGREVARKAKAFDARVIAVNRSGQGEGDADEVMAVARLHEALPKADAVFLCLPFTKDTRNLIDAKALVLMKPTAVLINVARGELVDTDALVEALRAGKLGGAGLDVIEPEPLPDDHPLWDFDNVIVSPHVSGHGGPLYERLAELFADNIERFHDGKPLRNVVSLDEHQV